MKPKTADSAYRQLTESIKRKVMHDQQIAGAGMWYERISIQTFLICLIQLFVN